MKKSLRLVQALALVALLLSASLVMPARALAVDVKTTHDGDEIRQLLAEDGDVDIVLDADVRWNANKISGHYWCTLGSGNKSIDLAGHDLTVAVDNHNDHTEWIPSIGGSSTVRATIADTLYMFRIRSGSALTINDTTRKNEGEILFDGYLHSAANGTAGTHTGNMFNRSVVYRNVFLVEGGSLTFNGGTIGTRSKQQYVSPARDVFSLLGGRIDANARQQVNCVGITMGSGGTTINGGVVSGRGFSRMYTAPIEYGAWGLSEYERAAAVRATGGTLVVNDGLIQGKGCANVLEASEGVGVSIRAGRFTTHKIDYVLVPHYTDGTIYGTGAPRYMNGSYGAVGIDKNYLNSGTTDVLVNGTYIAESEWNTDNLDSTHDVTVKPRSNNNLTLYDTRSGTATAIEGREILWDGVSECKIQVPVEQYFTGYPWMSSYWIAVAQSTKSKPEGRSPSIYVSGTKITDADAATVEKEVAYLGSDSAIQSLVENHSGTLSFDLSELRPEGVGMGESFLVDFYICQNLQPYNTGGYTQYYNITKTLLVNIEPTNPKVTSQPASVYEEGSATTTTLTAKATGATDAWWVCEWPTYEVIESTDSRVSVSTDSEGVTTSTLMVPINNSARYYRCYFKNDYATEKTETACVRYALNREIVGTDTTVTIYERSTPQMVIGGDLIVTGDLCAAFMSVAPEDREVNWYRISGENLIPVNTESGNNIIPSTPHYHIGHTGNANGAQYKAKISIQLNGSTVSFWTGIYTLDVRAFDESTQITRVDLCGLGHPYLGDPAPSIATTGDDRYSIESTSWTGTSGGASGGALTVREANFQVLLQAKEGYTFANNGMVDIYLDGKKVGTTASAPASSTPPDPHTRVAASYTFSKDGHVELVPGAGLESVEVDLKAGEVANVDISSLWSYTSYGATSQNSNLTPNAFNAVSLPEWASLSADGTLTGTVPASAAATSQRSALTFRVNGFSSDISSGITLNVSKATSYMALTTNESARNHVHTWGAWVNAGNGAHVHTCIACGGKEEEPHAWDDGTQTVDPTPTSPGVMLYTCEECGATKTEPVPYESHTVSLVAAKEPTCTEDGNVAYYLCDECGLMFHDAGATDVIPAGEEVIPATGHSWSAWETIAAPTSSTAGLQRRVCANDSSHVEELATYLITFDLAGGTLNGQTGTVTLVGGDGEVITMPEPTRAGYTFAYWRGSRYAAGEAYTVTGNHTFTAEWTRATGSSPSGVSPATGDNTHNVTPLLVAGVILVLSGALIRRRGA